MSCSLTAFCRRKNATFFLFLGESLSALTTLEFVASQAHIVCLVHSRNCPMSLPCCYFARKVARVLFGVVEAHARTWWLDCTVCMWELSGCEKERRVGCGLGVCSFFQHHILLQSSEEFVNSKFEPGFPVFLMLHLMMWECRTYLV